MTTNLSWHPSLSTHLLAAGLYPGVIPENRSLHLAKQTVLDGDMRRGIELMRRVVMATERDGRSFVIEDDMVRSFELPGNGLVEKPQYNFGGNEIPKSRI